MKSIYNPLAFSEAAEGAVFVLLEAHKGHGHRTGAKVPPPEMFGTRVAPHFWVDTAKLRPGPRPQENKHCAWNNLDADCLCFTALAWGSEDSWVPTKLFKW